MHYHKSKFLRFANAAFEFLLLILTFIFAGWLRSYTPMGSQFFMWDIWTFLPISALYALVIVGCNAVLGSYRTLHLRNSIKQLFLIALTSLMGLALMIYNWATSKKYGWKGNGRRFNFKALGKSFIDSFWAILSPVIILGGIYGGFFTPTEAAAVSCVYTFIIGTFVYKEIHWKEFVDCMKDTVVIAGATSFIVGMSTSFAYVMTLEQVPETLSAFILGISDNKIIILLLMNVFLLVVGMFMDNISSCTILAPILLPVAVALGVNPVHFGIVMTMNLAIGFITPPYGVNLYVGSSVAHIPFERIVKWIWPFIGVIIVVLLLTTYIPQLSLLLV